MVLLCTVYLTLATCCVCVCVRVRALFWLGPKVIKIGTVHTPGILSVIRK